MLGINDKRDYSHAITYNVIQVVCVYFLLRPNNTINITFKLSVGVTYIDNN